MLDIVDTKSTDNDESLFDVIVVDVSPINI